MGTRVGKGARGGAVIVLASLTGRLAASLRLVSRG
jgi:hypothetical protein